MGVKSVIERKVRDPEKRNRFELRPSAGLLDALDAVSVALGVTQSAFVTIAVAHLAADLGSIQGLSREDLRKKVMSLLEEALTKVR